MHKAICFAIAAFIFAACGNSNQSVAEKKFPVTQPIQQDTSFVVEYIADIHSVQNVEIRARIMGYLESINVDEGELVKKGQVLFNIGSLEYEEELHKARANYKNVFADAKAAELEVQNVKVLLEKNIVSKTELDFAKVKLDAANAKVEEAKSMQSSAEIKLALTQIKAPFDGIIDRIPNKTGSLIDEGTLLSTVSDNQEVFAYFHISEKEYLEMAAEGADSIKNKEISLVLANNELHKFKGKIETTEGEFDNTTGTIAFRARFPNPEKLLKHGSSGKVRLYKKIKQALLIPQKATFEIQDRMYVYVLDANNKVTAKNITIRSRLPHLYVVDKGLTVNDKIIYEGIQLLKNDLIITPEMVTMKKIIKDLVSK